jgi:excisionase family DNA binding protein
MEELKTPEEVADFLRVPKTTLYRWRLVGEGPPAIKVGKHLRYRSSDLDAWTRSLEATAARKGSAR